MTHSNHWLFLPPSELPDDSNVNALTSWYSCRSPLVDSFCLLRFFFETIELTAPLTKLAAKAGSCSPIDRDIWRWSSRMDSYTCWTRRPRSGCAMVWFIPFATLCTWDLEPSAASKSLLVLTVPSVNCNRTKALSDSPTCSNDCIRLLKWILIPASTTAWYKIFWSFQRRSPMGCKSSVSSTLPSGANNLVSSAVATSVPSWR